MSKRCVCTDTCTLRLVLFAGINFSDFRGINDLDGTKFSYFTMLATDACIFLIFAVTLY